MCPSDTGCTALASIHIDLDMCQDRIQSNHLQITSLQEGILLVALEVEVKEAGAVEAALWVADLAAVATGWDGVVVAVENLETAVEMEEPVVRVVLLGGWGGTGAQETLAVATVAMVAREVQMGAAGASRMCTRSERLHGAH